MNSDNYENETDKSYRLYLSSLLKGDRLRCASVIQEHIRRNVPVKTVYQDFFQRSLYKVGELWEHNKISVASEHIATAITEGIMNQIYPEIISKKRTGKTIVMSCLEDEFHQVGGKMVSDLFEMHGWDSFYLGANTPTNEMIRFIHEKKPDYVGVSLSVYFHIRSLINALDLIKNRFPDMNILIGGQAFRFVKQSDIASFPDVTYLKGLDDVEKFLTDQS